MLHSSFGSFRDVNEGLLAHPFSELGAKHGFSATEKREGKARQWLFPHKSKTGKRNDALEGLICLVWAGGLTRRDTDGNSRRSSRSLPFFSRARPHTLTSSSFPRRASHWLSATAISLLASSPAFATDFMVNSDGPLRAALANAVAGDSITFTANISTVSDLPAITQNLTINGNNFTLSGAQVPSTANGNSALFVFSGTVAINNLTISQVTAQGGAGGNGAGGGGGLGGALFVASGANVTVSNVSLLNNVAQGGNGGSGASAPIGGGGGGGGGLGGAGGSAGSGGGGGGGGVGNPAAGGLGGPFIQNAGGNGNLTGQGSGGNGGVGNNAQEVGGTGGGNGGGGGGGGQGQAGGGGGVNGVMPTSNSGISGDGGGGGFGGGGGGGSGQPPGGGGDARIRPGKFAPLTGNGTFGSGGLNSAGTGGFGGGGGGTNPFIAGSGGGDGGFGGGGAAGGIVAGNGGVGGWRGRCRRAMAAAAWERAARSSCSKAAR